MTTQRIAELLGIELECVMRNSQKKCDRNCADCDLVQEDWELIVMYQSAIDLVKAHEEIEPYMNGDEAQCPDCRVKLTSKKYIGANVFFEDFFEFCPKCGKRVLWK